MRWGTDFSSEKTLSAVSFPFRIFEILFLAAVLSVPLYLGAVFLWSFSASAMLCAAGFLIHWFSRLKSGDATLLHTPLDGAILAYLLFFTASCLQTHILWRTLEEAFKTLAVLSGFVATVHYCHDRSHIRRLCTALALLGGLLSIYGLLQYLGGLPHSWWDKAHFLSSVYVNHNHFAGLLEIVLPLSLGLVIAEKDTAKKILLIFLCGLMGAASVFTLSRGGIVAITVALALMLFLLTKKRVLNGAVWVFVFSGLLAVGAILAFGVEPIVERLQSLETLRLPEKFIRPLVWKGTVALIRQFPWLGTGPGTYEFMFLKFRPEGLAGRPVYAHNDYLHVLADCGVFVFTATLVIFVILFVRGWSTLHRDESRLRISLGSGCLAAGLALAIHSVSDFNFHISANWMLFGVLSGILVRLAGIPDKPSAVWRRITGPAVTLLFLAVFFGSIYMGVFDFLRWSGKQSLKRGDAIGSRRALDMAVSMNRLDAQTYYLRALALAKDQRQEPAQRYPLAVADLEKAITLNSYEPYYEFNRAKYYSKILTAEELYKSLPYYQKTLQKDPNDPTLYYLAGKELLSDNTSRNKEVEDYSKRVLAKGLFLDDAYSVKVYGVLWNYEKNIASLEAFSENTRQGLQGLLRFLEASDLWAYHRKVYFKSLGVDIDSEDEAVRSLASSSGPQETYTLEGFAQPADRKISSGAHFYSNGELTKRVEVLGEKTLLLLKARSRKIRNGYAYLRIKLDTKTINTFYIDGRGQKEYPTLIRGQKGPHTLGIELTNVIRTPGQDRDVWIEEILLRDVS